MKKLIRDKYKNTISKEEWIEVKDKEQLNYLYSIKIQEELNEVIESNFNDKKEFADLLQVIINFAEVNGIPKEELFYTAYKKSLERGEFSNTALLNPWNSNPSNIIYFNNKLEK